MWIILLHFKKFNLTRKKPIQFTEFHIESNNQIDFSTCKHQIDHTCPINVKRSSSVCQSTETSTTKRKGFVLFLPFRRRTCQPFGKKIKISNNRNANQIIIDSSWVTFQYQSFEEFQSFYLVFFIFFILQALDDTWFSLKQSSRLLRLMGFDLTVITLEVCSCFCLGKSSYEKFIKLLDYVLNNFIIFFVCSPSITYSKKMFKYFPTFRFFRIGKKEIHFSVFSLIFN